MKSSEKQNLSSPLFRDSLPDALLSWYDAHARVLPWRETPTPYRVWVSEIMLQQTRVEAVKPYFERFLSALPTVSALAEADSGLLLKLWEGLGYYNRARNLQKAAAVVKEQYAGRLPASFEALRALPGIGSYTAGAIASIAFGIPVPAVDGNVLRVASRLLDSREDIKNPAFKQTVEDGLRQILPKRVGDFNQALMELGATVCLPSGQPRCGECPLSGLCAGFAAGTAPDLPVKSAAKARRIEERTVFLLIFDGRTALRKRPESGLLASMWEFPNTEGNLPPEEAAALIAEWGMPPEALTPLKEAKHIFTHVEWRMTGYAAFVPSPSPDFVWADAAGLSDRFALPSAFRFYFSEAKRLLGA